VGDSDMLFSTSGILKSVYKVLHSSIVTYLYVSGDKIPLGDFIGFATELGYGSHLVARSNSRYPAGAQSYGRRSCF
jgi:hypothetical protein